MIRRQVNPHTDNRGYTVIVSFDDNRKSKLYVVSSFASASKGETLPGWSVGGLPSFTRSASRAVAMLNETVDKNR